MFSTLALFSPFPACYVVVILPLSPSLSTANYFPKLHCVVFINFTEKLLHTTNVNCMSLKTFKEVSYPLLLSSFV